MNLSLQNVEIFLRLFFFSLEKGIIGKGQVQVIVKSGISEAQVN